MDISLKIYDGKNVVKTYTAETFDCEYGVIADIIDIIDFDAKNSNIDLAKIILKMSKQLKPFLKQVFPGLTDEEMRHTKIQNIVSVFKSLYSYATEQMLIDAGNEKN